MLPASLSYYNRSYQSHPPLLRGHNQRPLSAEESTHSCEALLATAMHHGCCHWLPDGRSHQQAQPRELHEWMQEEYWGGLAKQERIG